MPQDTLNSFDLAKLPAQPDVKPAENSRHDPSYTTEQSRALAPKAKSCKANSETFDEHQASVLMDQAGASVRESLRQCRNPTGVDGTLYEEGGTSVKWNRALGAKLRIKF